MTQTYLTQQGDELDDICHRFYGYSSGSVETVLALDANRDLALELPVLREGLVVTLPSIAPPSAPPPLKLWS